MSAVARSSSEVSACAPLMAPLALRNVRLRNRIVVSPMQTYSSTSAKPSAFHLVHLGRFALGGAALVSVEATAVCPEGRSTTHDLGLWSEEQADAFRPITDFLREHGAASAVQIQHAGTKSACRPPWRGFGPLQVEDAQRGEVRWEAWGPTSAGWSPAYPPSHPVQRADVDYLLNCYRRATRLAHRAGFDVVEVHAAHGYLLHSFLSPLMNHRTDEFGGSLEGRMKLPLEVAKVVREEWPDDRPVMLRMSCVDGNSVGWSIEDSVEFARRLKAVGIDVVDCSSGGANLPNVSDLVPRRPGFQAPFARAVREGAGIATIAVGLISDARHANAIIEEGSADFVAMGRELLWNPNFPAQAGQTLGADPGWDLWPRQFGWWLKRRARAQATN